MQKSDSISKLSKALANVQATLSPAIKDAVNPHLKSKYADLNAIWDACREPLSKNGFSLIQGNSVGIDNTVIVETLLMHESGEWIQSELALPLTPKYDKNTQLNYTDAQSVGSAITYGRRYGLSAMIGIVAEADDDGHAASRPQAPRTQAPIKAVEQPTSREKIAIGIGATCKELNAAGDSIKWAPKTLNDYITEMFGGGINFDTANEKQLTTVSTDLAKRLAALKGGK